MSSVVAPRVTLGGGLVRSAAAVAGVALVLVVVTRIPAPTFLQAAVVVGLLGVGLWMFLSERYALTLGVLMAYLLLLDGYLKLAVGGSLPTLGRDVLLYAIVGGASARLLIRRTPLRMPPLSGWILLYAAIVITGVANPGSQPTSHAISALRPHLEFLPLFFFGYFVVRSSSVLRGFLLILLICGAANGVVGAVQGSLSPEQLASWGPGYAQRINGTDGAAGRTFAGADGRARVRPFGLGADAGGGGLIALLALPAGLALMTLARRRPWLALLAMALAGCCVLGIVTSQGRSFVIAAFIVVFVYVALAVTSQRLVPTLAVVLIAGVVTAIVVDHIASSTDLSRYRSIRPSQLTQTASQDRGDALALVPDYAVRFPFGNALGSSGPATGFGGLAVGLNTGSDSLSGETEFNFMVLEAGIAGLAFIVIFPLRLCWLVLRGVRRVRLSERRILLSAFFAPLFAIVVLFFGGAPTVGSPLGPYFWTIAGAAAYWLIAGRSRGALETSG